MITFSATQKEIIYQQIALIVTVQGSVDKISVRLFEKQLQDYLNVGFYFIILDCSSLKAINSTGLQVLLKMVDVYHQAGGLFLFVKVLTQIAQCFDRMGFTPIFTSFSNHEEAIAYLEEQLRKSVAEDQKSKSPSSQSPQISSPQSSLPPPPQNPPAIRSPVTPLDVSRGRVVGTSNNQLIMPNIPQRPNTSRLEVTLETQGFPTTTAFHLISINFNIVSIKGSKKSSILNIVPYFPGCIVIPEYRALYLAAGQQTSFWITPLLTGKIPSWFELWCGEESIQQWMTPIRVVSFRIVGWLIGLAILIALACFFLPIFSKIRDANLPSWFITLAEFLQSSQMIGYCFSVALIIGSLCYYLICRSIHAKTVQQKFMFEA